MVKQKTSKNKKEGYYKTYSMLVGQVNPTISESMNKLISWKDLFEKDYEPEEIEYCECCGAETD